MPNPLVSVIVPVYNAEKTIENTLRSVLCQTLPDFEVVAVDDGSTDKSLSICRSLAQEDSRIRVLSRPNGGCGAARNTALDAALGTYLCFVDADDKLEPDALENMVRCMEGCDLLIARFYFQFGDNLDTKQCLGVVQEEGKRTGDEMMLRLMRHPTTFYFSVLWNKMYRRDIVQKNQIRFDETMHWGEDSLFNFAYMAHVRQMYFLKTPVYSYKKAMHSTSNLGAILHFSSSVQTKLRMFGAYKALCKKRGTWKTHWPGIVLYPVRFTWKN